MFFLLVETRKKTITHATRSMQMMRVKTKKNREDFLHCKIVNSDSNTSVEQSNLITADSVQDSFDEDLVTC